VHNTRFLPIAVIALLPFLDTSVEAQGNGKMTPYEIKLHKLEDKSWGGSATIDMKGRVWVSTLVGEPVIACNAEWSFWNGVGSEPVITINNKRISGIPRKVLDKITLHSVKLGFATKPLDERMFARNTRYELSCDPGAMEKPDSGKTSFTVPGSYSWDKTFYVRGSYDGKNKSSATFADKATAKQIMIHLLENGLSSDSSSAKVLTAQLNLGAVVNWLKDKEKLAEKKLKKQKKTKGDKRAVKKKDNFWSTVKNIWNGTKKDKTGTAKTNKNSADDDFWSGKKLPGKQANNEQTQKGDGDKFWSGDTSDERKKRQAGIQKQQELERKQLAAAAKIKAKADAKAEANKLVRFSVGSNIHNRKYGFKNNNGDIVIPAWFEFANDFSEGLATAHLWNKYWGVIDEKAQGRDRALKWVIEPNYRFIGRRFSEGLVWAEGRKKRGYLDRKGEWAIPPKFESTQTFSEGLAAVAISGRNNWGFIDLKGNWVIRPRWDTKPTPFKNGRTEVEIYDKNSLSFFIVIFDKTGRELSRRPKEPRVHQGREFKLRTLRK